MLRPGGGAAAAAPPSTWVLWRHGAGGVGDPRGMRRVRVHQLRRVAHAVRCAACDRSGTRGTAAPVSSPGKGEGGVARASFSTSPGCSLRPEQAILCAPEDRNAGPP